MTKSRSQCLIVFAALLLTTPVLCAQDQQDNPIAEKKIEPKAGFSTSGVENQPSVTEEVIVTGQHSVSTIRREMFKVQDMVYSTFNELNEDDDYDMVCVKEARIGSQIKYKKCRGRFITEELSKGFVDWRDDGHALISWTEIRKKSLRQKEIMAELANQNPHFLALLKKRLALKKAYEAKRDECGWDLGCQNRDREQ